VSTRTIGIDDRLYQYLLKVSLRDDPILRALREETAALPLALMQISPEQGQFMALLVEISGAAKAIEIGTFTGYSSLCVARALPQGGRLICCDISKEFTDIARRHWRQAGIADRIDLRLGPALETLRALNKTAAGSFDFAFIDADKSNYLKYYEAVLTLLRPGGIVLIDNVLWSGDVADPSVTDSDTSAIRQLNEHLLNDKRIGLSLVPIGDGLTIARKK
jgi:predicted O-methyltransferase YrrM